VFIVLLIFGQCFVPNVACVSRLIVHSWLSLRFSLTFI
jgi:hypothetical protein